MPYGINDQYEIEKILQESAATAVLLVRHKTLQKLRIMKLIKADDPQSFRIQSEANLLAGNYSPQLPTIYDVGQLNNWNYLILEYIEGQSLREYLLQEKEIDLDTVLNISLEICDVIKALHGAKPEPIIYRDMKPEHIFLTESGTRIIDLGISAYKSKTKDDVKGYTPKYAPREQVEGIVTDELSDIYSIGRVISEMLQKVPTKDQKGLEVLVEKACSENRDTRIKSVDILMKELQGLQNTKGYENKKRKHLNKTIAVIGNNTGVGCTHIAMDLVVYMRKKGIDTYYLDHAKGRTLQHILETKPDIRVKDGVLYHNYFCGYLEYGQCVEETFMPQAIQVMDEGKSEELIQADIIFYIISGSAWKRELIPEWIHNKNVYVISNFSDKGKDILLARSLRKRIYAYPFDQKIGHALKAKNCIYENILRDERLYD